MKRPVRHKVLPVLLAANAALLVLVLLAVVSGGPSLVSTVYGQTAVPASSGGDELLVVPAQMSANTWGCYVVDKRKGTICAYQYLPGERNLKLQAARGFVQDLQLTNFNTSPSPQEVQDLVNKERDLRGNRAPAASGQNEQK